MVDTNVFAQDSIRLIEKLIDLGLDFEAMLYPSQGHGFTDGSAGSTSTSASNAS
jgi:dipeptidyl aminopeptidase/acylaminoacyl peptidase